MLKMDKSVSPVDLVQMATLTDTADKNWIVSPAYQKEFSMHICEMFKGNTHK